MAKQLTHGEYVRQAILRGVNQLADAVKVTLGPRGKNVIIENPFGPPSITKDGVSVARVIELSDPLENMGAQAVREVASKTADVAGDGTTTATVLAQAIFREGVKVVSAGADAMALKRGIDAAVNAIVGNRNSDGEYNGGALQQMSVDVSGDMITQVASISANGDAQIGSLIAEAVTRVGCDGVITVDSSHSIDTELKTVDGMQFDRGYISGHFITDPERRISDLSDAYVLIYDRKITLWKSLEPALGISVRKAKPLLIIAEDIEADALSFLAINHLQGKIRVVAVKAPGFGDRRRAMLDDIAALTGATVISDDMGTSLEKLTEANLGQAKRIVVDKDNTTIQEGAGDRLVVDGRAAEIRSLLESAPTDYDREKLQERLAKLISGVAVIRVGGATETEVKEKKDRVDDALHATWAAMEEGIVPGGGLALLNCSGTVDEVVRNLDGDEKIGASIIRRAIEEPIRQIVANGGGEGTVVIAEIKRQATSLDFGYNAATGNYEDLIQAGVIDPSKVTRCALQNAASIAGLLLTTDCMISQIREKPQTA